MEFLKKLIVLAVLAGAAFYGWQAWIERPVNPPLESDVFDGWVEVAGRVTDIRSEKFGGGRPAETTIFYEYPVDGRTYRYETFHRHPDETTMNRVFRQYPIGSSIMVRYDPKQPRRSYVIKPNSISIYS